MLRRSASRLAWYFGLRWGDPEFDRQTDGPPTMTPVRAGLVRGAVALFAGGIGLAALVVLVFDWSPQRMLPGALVGAVVWGAVSFYSAVRRQIPGETRLRPAPTGTTIERDRWWPLRVLLCLPLFLGLAWLSDRWGSGGFFVPGQFFGWALADLAGALLVGRWQGRHGQTVLMRWTEEEPDLYAAP